MSSVDNEREIHSLFEAADRALMAADIDALSRVFGDDYVQYDASGKVFSKREVLDSLRSGEVRYPSIVSTGRRIRLFGDVAIVHGSELDEVEADGKRFPVRYLYMDVVCKRDGRWQIVGSQLVKPADT
jgi:ketosteroid isomerase-like protein